MQRNAQTEQTYFEAWTCIPGLPMVKVAETESLSCAKSWCRVYLTSWLGMRDSQLNKTWQTAQDSDTGLRKYVLRDKVERATNAIIKECRGKLADTYQAAI